MRSFKVCEYGKGTPSFTGSTFYPRDWNGTLYTVTGPAGPALAVNCSTPGQVTASFSNFTPGGPIAVAYGAPAAYVHSGVQCNGLALDLIPATLPLILFADGAGSASLTRSTGACGSGILAQAADIATCVASNSAAL